MPRPGRRTMEQTREHVLEVAGDLFYRNGIRATGVDKIAAEAGIAPTTLYRLYASKDDLVAAYTERAGERQRRGIAAAAVADGRPTPDRILALFDLLRTETEAAATTDTDARSDAQPACRGCAFIMVLTELPEESLAAHRHAVGMKEWIRATLHQLAAELPGVADPAELADQLVLILDGYTATAQALGPDGPASRARGLAKILLDRATNGTAGTDPRAASSQPVAVSPIGRE